MPLPPTQSLFELLLARPVLADTGQHESLVHLWWRASHQGHRLVQVYLNGRIVDVSIDPAQRELWLLVDRFHPSRGHRIELLAVDASDPQEIWADHPEHLQNWNPRVTSEAHAIFLRDERLDVNSRIAVNLDGQPLDESPLWDAREHRGGFGALLGLGGFGRDSATGLGLGLGELGMGPLGEDATAWRWRRDDLPTGDHDLRFTALDSTGLEITQPVDRQITVDSLPLPATAFTVNDVFTLSWEP